MLGGQSQIQPADLHTTELHTGTVVQRLSYKNWVSLMTVPVGGVESKQVLHLTWDCSFAQVPEIS